MSEIVFSPFTHADMVAGVHAIADASRDWSPSLLVGVGRGGLAPAVFLSHRMGLPLVSVDHSSGIAEFGQGLLPVLAARSRKGERILFVEDINDSGKTIGELRAALGAQGADADRIRFAVLIDNVRSAQKVEYRYRRIDRGITKDWFVFPWEALASNEAVTAEAMQVPDRIA